MNDTLRMSRVESVRNLESYINNVGSGERVTFDSGGKVFAIHELHGDEMDAVRLANLVDVSDVRVVDGRGGFRFAHETRTAFLVLGELRRKDLESDLAAELRILGQIDIAHPA